MNQKVIFKLYVRKAYIIVLFCFVLFAVFFFYFYFCRFRLILVTLQYKFPFHSRGKKMNQKVIFKLYNFISILFL